MEQLSSIATMALRRKDKKGDQDHQEGKKPANPLTYPKSAQPFSAQLFQTPTSEYRGCPLWAWNTKLDKKQLLRQIDNFADMGMGGFHMHVRTGLDTEYMGPEFMDLVRSCVDYAESKNMLACLYDEDRWPSGAAGGLVIAKYPETKGKHLLFTPYRYGTVELGGDRSPSSARACRSENGRLLARYDISLDDNACLESSRILEDGEAGANIWYLYEETNPGSPWFNDQTYIDTLSVDAMARFIEMTHETYKAKIGDKFGTVVPCIFTDEPQFAIKTQLSNPRAAEDIFLPWTTDLALTFKKEYSADLIKDLPQLVWNLPEGKASATRYQYHDHVCERFVTSFMDQIGRWCKKNGIMLNGHMMEEPTLYSQTTALGEAMRCYRSMEMPGMDLLCDWVEYNTAKQVSSVARQNGLRGAMSEIYGVTHWDFTFEGHKGCGDWQAALGITFRVHHLTWSPWYKEYGYVEDHFARVGVAMTRGKAVTKVGVIHPIESYWLAFGPNGSGDELQSRDRAFGDLSNWLLHGLIDFDFISESLLPGQISGKITGNQLRVGKCEYEVVIVPNLRTIRSTTLKILREFSRAGGQVIVAGSAPTLVDAQMPRSNPVIENSLSIFWSQQNIISALDKHRDIRIVTDQGAPTDRLLHQIRQDGDHRFVFVCNTNRTTPTDTTVKLKGLWNVGKLDTFTGKESSLCSQLNDGWTIFTYRFEGCASLLLRLSPFKPELLPLLGSFTPSLDVKTVAQDIQLEKILFSEPNVLLLDYAEYKLDDESWSEPIEVLRIDNIIRSRLKIPPKGFAWRQPWTVSESDRASKAQATLRFTFSSSFDISESLSLAVEDADKFKISVNESLIQSAGCSRHSYWVDEAITKLTIPKNTIKKGSNTILLSFPFGILTNIERIYILGWFQVVLTGRSTVLKPLRNVTSKVRGWGDIVDRGFPFYVGNVTYNCSFSIDTNASKTNVTLKVPEFSSPVLSVHDQHSPTTGSKLGNIAFQPRTLYLGKFGPGEHKISITAYGNRYNSFGHIHAPAWVPAGCWPDLWRTGGDWWTDDYSLRAVGVLACPKIEISEVVSETEHINEDNNDQDWVVVR
ncbi:Uncharacterized protein BP5553_09787 [Venustampulla echinocandica]|uniref:Glycoside hydrolase family 2 protein n=1 Tax=Venustampulla echinocandica TaxID=2656787 RepID=A0A370TAR0_9HELO|nr:Uncharacterized protein BP5553_09787 [Venustampulla echinocandica]RDL30998.1 Uncharacterized protein BP5553_09787 [Venustampulla echinocandica]